MEGRSAILLSVSPDDGFLTPDEEDLLPGARDGGEHMNAETETAIQNLSKAFADTSEFMSIMKQIANSLVNIELHLQAMRPPSVQTVRGPTR